jgi:hypothetical protein
MTHGTVHSLLAKRQLTPAQAAEAVVKERAQFYGAGRVGLWSRVSLFALLIVAAIFGVRDQRSA